MKTWDEEYQRQVWEGFTPEHGVDGLSHCALGLTAESGEVADIVKKSQYRGGSLNEADLKLELGDALWYLTAIAKQFGWTLTDLALSNVAKLEKRRGAPYDLPSLVAVT